jgi:hypothetical protein
MLIYKDGQVAHYKEIFSNTSFSASGPSDEFLAENGAKKVTVFKAHDRATQKLVSVDPYEEDGIVYTVSVVDKTAEEIAADSNSKAAQIRSQRNQLLTASDWTQVLDAPVDRTAWAAYRQALRDITSQEGFPASVQWPNDPNYVAPAGNID